MNAASMGKRYWIVTDDARLREDLMMALTMRGAQGVGVSSIDVGGDGAELAGVLVHLSSERAASRLAEITRLRAGRPRVPVLALLDTCSPEVLDALHLLDVTPCGAPLTAKNLDRFLADAGERGVDVAMLRERVMDKALAKGLSRRETELLLLATSGLSRRELATQLGVSENTVKAQIRSLLKKTGARSLAVLGQQVLRGDTVPPPTDALMP